MNISLKAVGDISFGDSPKCFGFGVKRVVEKKGADFIFEKIKGQLNSDILFGNLETVLSDKSLVAYDFYSDQMRGPVECVDALWRAGFNVLNIANNHMLEHGAPAFWDCIERLRRKKIAIVGLKGFGDYFSEPAILDTSGGKIGFLGYSLEEDNRLGSLGDIDYANCTDPEKIYADVNSLKCKVDLVIVSLHWGLEFASGPSMALVEIARRIVDAGANIILGHHPHVVQCIEKYRGGTICYSLANFVFDMMWNKRCCRSMIVQFELQNDKIDKMNFYPVKINRNYQPELDVDEKALLYLERLSQMHLEHFATKEVNIEYENLTYYKNVAVQQLKDTVLSNLFLLATTVSKTPYRYLPGKMRYIFKKVC